MKILSPAGNFDCLRAAVINGADEVYLGINEYNARNNVDGFTADTLKSAVDFARVYGVKVNLAINILFTDDELQSAFDTVIKAYNDGVDCFIIQDLALAKLLNDYYPEIEKHASTQMGIHNLEGVKAIEPYGFKRVVLARETPLKEIRRIKENSGVEIEYFAHGALCVSFSGNCYLSSYMLGASGNRGRCKQLCRLPYTLKKDGATLKKGYLLSAKDFNMTKRLKDLKLAGVDVIKIEGRARRAFYVATATKEYRRAIDGKIANQESLKLAFNREYTEGYFNGNGGMISELQNHVGISVGEVVKVNYGKKFNEVFFTSTRELHAKSTLKVFRNGQETAVVSAYDLTKSGKNYRLTTTAKIAVGDKINLISDAMLEDVAAGETKKVQVPIAISVKVGEPIKAVVSLLDKTVEIKGETLTAAIKQPLTVSELEDNFKKSEYFNASLSVEMGGDAFIRKQDLNEFRRLVFNRVYNELTEKYRRNLQTVKIKTNIPVKTFSDFEFVESEEENALSRNVVFSPDTYSVERVMAFKKRCESMGKCAYLDTPPFALKEDIELIRDIIDKTKIKVVANNYYALALDGVAVIGGGLNVYNTVTADIHGKEVITAERDFGSKKAFPYMTLRHCPFKSHLGFKCGDCTYNKGYELIADNGKRLKIKRKRLTDCTFYLTD